MPIFELFKKNRQEKNNYDNQSRYDVNEKEDWKEPEFDYSPECYDMNYPRHYNMASYAVLEDGVVFTRDVKDYLLRDLVKRVIFTDAPFPEGHKLVDLSLEQDRSILGWNQTIGDDLCLIVSTGERGKGIEFNEACNFMFAGFENLKSIEWNNVTTTKNVVSMRQMFAGCENLKRLDLSSFDVRNAKYMDGMFSTCEKLEDIKWFRFNTANVEDVSRMFTNCHSLRAIDLSGFDTTSLTNCKKMFNRCAILRAVNLGNWSPNKDGRQLNIEDMFHTTGLLSVLTTGNEEVKRLFLNPPDAETRDCLIENNIERKVVPVSEWKIPTYAWDKMPPSRGEALTR